MRLFIFLLFYSLTSTQVLAIDVYASPGLPGKTSALVGGTTWDLRPTFRDALSDFRWGDGVTHLVEWDDGAGATLYAIGDFAVVGDRPARHFARWDGKRWVPLAADPSWPYSNYPYRDLVVFENRLLAGGSFRVSADSAFWGVAEWTGANWVPFNGAAAAGDYPRIQNLSVEGNRLLVRGSLNELGPGFSGYLALWDGDSWVMIATPNDLGDAVLFQGQPHATGTFPTKQGNVYVARWNGDQWEALAGGPSFRAEQITVTGGRLVVANNFESVGGVPDASVAAWDGVSWTAMPNAPEMDQHTIQAYDGGFVTTRYTGWGSSLTPHPSWVGFWNGAGWEPFAAGGVGHATLIHPYGEGLLFGGYNSHRLDDDAGSGPMRLVYWSEDTGSVRFNRGFMAIRAVEPYLNGLVMGGALRALGWEKTNCVAAWIDSGWVPLGDGIPDCGVHEGAVADLATRGSEVLALVSRHPNSSLPRPIWHWNGSSWVNTGLDTQSMFDVGIATAGGDFWLFGGGRVWRLNEGAWEAVESGMDGEAVAVFEHLNEMLLQTSTSVQRLDGDSWVSQYPAPGGTGSSVVSHDGRLHALIRHQFNTIGVSTLSDGVWEQPIPIAANVQRLKSTPAGLVALGGSTWILRDGEWVQLTHCDGSFSRTTDVAHLGNELIVSGSYNAYHSSLCALGAVDETTISMQVTVDGPEFRRAVVTATVTGSSAPTRGIVGIDAEPGGSCTIDLLTTQDSTSSLGTCEIVFSRAQPVTMIASYYGGGLSEGAAWGPSQSSPILIEVGATIFVDDFE